MAKKKCKKLPAKKAALKRAKKQEIMALSDDAGGEDVENDTAALDALLQQKQREDKDKVNDMDKDTVKVKDEDKDKSNTTTAFVLRSCINCKAGESPDLQLLYCNVCQSALYCSKTCQSEDWKKQHKQLCKLLNVGHGGLQVRMPLHTSRSIESKGEFENGERNLDEEDKRFFKLFQKSTFERSRAAVREMTKIAKRQTKHNQMFYLFHSLSFLIRSDSSEMLSWPNSPLLVLLQFIDPNVLSGDENAPFQEGIARQTPLHDLGELAAPSEFSTHENQLILAKQLIEHGANVNAATNPQGETPLHKACSWDIVTNLDFVELLLKKGADPNAQDRRGMTPLMYTTPYAPGVAKFLLNWPTTDVNITNRSGQSFLVCVRSAITEISDKVVGVQHKFLLRQWREIEEMLVERGAEDTSMTSLISMTTGRLFRFG
jgi:hypothetical protein